MSKLEEKTSLDTGTWRREGALAYWVFCHDGSNLTELVPSLLASLSPFAVVAEVSWSTAGEGEEALVQRLERAPTDQEVLGRAAHLRNVTAIYFYLDLICRGLEGGDVPVPEGASIALELRKGRIELTFSLNVDLFARKTATVNQDNRELSALNAPRLNAFLERLPQATGTTPCGFDANLYKGEFDEHGVPAEGTP